MFTGHNVVKVFGRQEEAIDDVRRAERASSTRRPSRPSSSPGIIMPVMNFVKQPQLRGHRRHRRPHGRQRPLSPRRRAGVHPVLAPVHAADRADRRHHERAAVGTAASAERVFELLDEPEETPDAADAASTFEPAGHVELRATCRSATSPDTPLIEDLTLDVQPGETVAIVGPTGAGKTTLVNLLMRFYELDGGAHPRRRRRHRGT